MNRFKKILCYVEPIDQAASAVSWALEVARKNSARLTLISFVNEIPIIARNLQQSFVDICQAQLKELLSSTDTTGIEIDLQVYVSNMGSIDTIKMVIDQHYDLVIKPTDNAGRSETILFGSNDQHLLRKCPVPVWIVKPHKKHRFERVLIAIDVDPAQPENNELNTIIMQLATSMVEQYDCELHIVHAWELRGEEVLRSPRSHWPQSDVDRMVEKTYISHKKWLDAFMQTLTLKKTAYSVHLEKGRADQVINQIVIEKNIDLTIMGTVARTGIPGFFIGNTAEKILASINCSVLTVKPSSFNSPVHL